MALIGVALAAGLVYRGHRAEAAPSKKITWNNAKVVRCEGHADLTSRRTIRLIGVDTPEKAAAGQLPRPGGQEVGPVGSTVRLGNPKSVKDKDRYGRSLRYVHAVSKHIDVSKSQIVKGSKARYDSRDGYQWHPRQSGYHKTDKNHKNYSCNNKKKSSGGHATKPIGHNCPKSAPIKGNKPSHIYHMPGQRFYKITGPEICFSTEGAAKRAGYRKSKV